MAKYLHCCSLRISSTQIFAREPVYTNCAVHDAVVVVQEFLVLAKDFLAVLHEEEEDDDDDEDDDEEDEDSSEDED